MGTSPSSVVTAFRHLFSSRYLVGLFYYAVCYLILSSVNHPIFCSKADDTNTELRHPAQQHWVDRTGLLRVHLNTAARYPYQKHYLLFALPV